MLFQLQLIAKHPITNILLALAVCLASGAEIAQEYIEESTEFGIHHGVGIYGLMLLFRAVLELIVSSGELSKGIEEIRKK